MPYTKHNYQKGDELLASQLNDMDDQIALNEQTADTLVTVSNTQPLEEKNRVWVKATPSEIEIPTMEDVDELKSALMTSAFAGQTDVIKTIVLKTTKAVTNNNDGTFTINTNDYGHVFFVQRTLKPGIYMLYGVPFGYSFLSRELNSESIFVTNSSDVELMVTITETTNCYVGYRNTSKPSSKYDITPYLKTSSFVENADASENAFAQLNNDLSLLETNCNYITSFGEDYITHQAWVTVTRRKNVYKFDGQKTTSSTNFFRMSSSFVGTGDADAAKSWERTVPMRSNHLYKISLQVLSGSSTFAGTDDSLNFYGVANGFYFSVKMGETKYCKWLSSYGSNALLIYTVHGSGVYSNYEFVLEINDVTANSLYDGKTISILGDSISTYDGWIPSGNVTYYPNGDITNVTSTWWHKIISVLGLSLDTNNSWSGSRVTTTNGDASAGCMTRCEDLGTNPDVIIVWMGINDFNHEVPLGTYDGKSAVPSTTTTFREAYGIMLNKILTKYQTSEVYVCTLTQCERSGGTGFPEINGEGVPLTEFNDAIIELAKAFGVKVLDYNACGLTYQNMSTYNPDELHMNALGHSLIANSGIKAFDNAVRFRYPVK